MLFEHCFSSLVPGRVDGSPEALFAVIDKANKVAERYVSRYNYELSVETKVRPVVLSKLMAPQYGSWGPDTLMWLDLFTTYLTMVFDRRRMLLETDVNSRNRRKAIRRQIEKGTWNHRVDAFACGLIDGLMSKARIAYPFWGVFLDSDNDYARYSEEHALILDVDEYRPKYFRMLEEDREYLCRMYKEVCQPSPIVRVRALECFKKLYQDIALSCYREYYGDPYEKEFSEGFRWRPLVIFLQEYLAVFCRSEIDECRKCDILSVYLAWAFDRHSHSYIWNKCPGMTYGKFCDLCVEDVSECLGLVLKIRVSEIIKMMQSDAWKTSNILEKRRFLSKDIGCNVPPERFFEDFSNLFREIIEKSKFVDTNVVCL